MKGYLCYLWRVIRRAFTQAPGIVDLWTGALSAALGVVDHYVPNLSLLTTYEWQISLWLIAGVVLARLLLAPYWIASESGAEIAKLEALTQPRLQLTVEREGGQITADYAAVAASMAGTYRKYIYQQFEYIRVLCTNTSIVPVTNCAAYLTSVKRVTENGVVEATGFTDHLPLTWSIAGDEDTVPQAVHPGIKHYINVLRRAGLPAQHGGPPVITSPKISNKYVFLFQDGGVYELTVHVSGDSIMPAQASLRVHFDPNRNSLEIVDAIKAA